jgi:hypothetical protein
VVVHIVIWSFKPSVTERDQRQLVADIVEMRDHVPMLRSVTAGPNLSPGRAGGFTHGTVVTLDDPAALAAYAEYPWHAQIKARLAAASEALVAIDYEA